MAAMQLQVRFTAISNSHHRVEMERPDGTLESAELETRSCLLHDIVHFAVETKAQLRDAFFGRIAAGATYESLAAASMPADPVDELGWTERVVGPLQGWLQRPTRSSAAEFVATLQSYQSSLGMPCPSWLTEELVDHVREQVTQLQGHWRGTPHGETMALTFTLTD